MNRSNSFGNLLNQTIELHEEHNGRIRFPSKEHKHRLCNSHTMLRKFSNFHFGLVSISFFCLNSNQKQGLQSNRESVNISKRIGSMWNHSIDYRRLYMVKRKAKKQNQKAWKNDDLRFEILSMSKAYIHP